MSAKLIRELEQRIVRQVIDDLLTAGFRLTVSLERGYDHDECLLGSRDAEKIMDEVFAGDDCHVFVHETDGDLLSPGTEANDRALLNLAMMGENPTDHKCLNSIGWVYFVHGNEGWDVISDYTTNLEQYIVKANEIADQYA